MTTKTTLTPTGVITETVFTERERELIMMIGDNQAEIKMTTITSEFIKADVDLTDEGLIELYYGYHYLKGAALDYYNLTKTN